jgi:hypothetical protein
MDSPYCRSPFHSWPHRLHRNGFSLKASLVRNLMLYLLHFGQKGLEYSSFCSCASDCSAIFMCLLLCIIYVVVQIQIQISDLFRSINRCALARLAGCIDLTFKESGLVSG